MEISEQIIAVFDNLAQKFGVIVDWGQENVIPYIQQLCTKYITWEIATSIIWIGFSVVFVLSGFVLFKSADKWHNAHNDDDYYEGVGRVLFIIVAIVCWIIALSIVTVQVFDVVRCFVFPELQIFRFVQSMTTHN